MRSRNRRRRKRDTVLVPLSGKSLDMLWLADAGYHVIGVEISDLACRDFFVENELVYRRIEEERFIKYSGENITLLCGDFFDLAREDLHETKLVYDRAALIALPKTMRQKYVAHLTNVATACRENIPNRNGLRPKRK